MRGINSNSVDLIYLDPPFNSNQNYAAPIGSEAAGAAFKDTWTLNDLDEAWHNQIADTDLALYRAIDASAFTHGNSMKSYLIMMAVRLMEMKRILKPNSSIYLHCDPTASHYLKMLMDVIFGVKNFRNEIVWHYYNKYGRGTRVFGRNYDQILFYAFGNYTFNPQREKRDKPTRQLVRENVRGVLRNKRDKNGKIMYRTVTDRKVDAVWRIPCVQPAAKQYVGYPTQKHLDLLKRVVLSSSNEGDVVLDPFCGCATTCIAAEQLGRKWVGIDLSPMARRLVEQRARRELGMMGGIQSTSTTVAPARTDLLPPPALRDSKATLYGLQTGNCKGCNQHFLSRNLTVDHIVPQSKGGTDHIENLQLLCGACNSLKGDRPMEYLRARLRRMELAIGP